MLTDYRIRQRDHLLEIVRALTQQLDLDTVLTRILRAATEMLAGRAGLIALREQPARGEQDGSAGFFIRAQHRVSPEFVRHFETVLQNTTSAALDDPARHIIAELERRLHMLARSGPFNLQGTIGLPLEAQGDLVGLLLVFRASASPSTRNERKILQAFADHAAVAVTNARLYALVSHEKRQLDAILEGSADGIMILDSGHRVLRWNRALAQLSEVNASAAIGRGHDDVISWNKKPDTNLADAEARGWPFGRAAPLYVEGDLCQPDGEGTPVGVTYAPIFDRQKRLVNLVANVRDITRFREAEKLKSTFISVISHELKTPVSLIKGYADTLLREDARWNKETINASLTVIEEEADRLTHLIDNLLDASRLQAGGLQLNLSTVRLDKLAAGLVRKFQNQTDKHELNVRFPADFPAIEADEERLRQALSNLISNAIKYSPEGGPVTISGRVAQREAVVTVADLGAGLPTGELERVFDRFHRAATSATESAQGAGLGLYLARAVIEAHDGRIWVHSDPGQGAAFHFSLPLEE
jgi:PAS domain S-box-containing protein